jgi:hypothetical protein
VRAGTSLGSGSEDHAVEREEQRRKDEPRNQHSLLHNRSLEERRPSVCAAGIPLVGGLPVNWPYANLVCKALRAIELGGLEPATFWVR